MRWSPNLWHRQLSCSPGLDASFAEAAGAKLGGLFMGVQALVCGLALVVSHDWLRIGFNRGILWHWTGFCLLHLFCLGPIPGNSQGLWQELLAVLGGPYGVLGIESGSAVYKASTVPAILSLWPPVTVIFCFMTTYSDYIQGYSFCSARGLNLTPALESICSSLLDNLLALGFAFLWV